MDVNDINHQVLLLDVKSNNWGNRFYELRTLLTCDILAGLEFRAQRLDIAQDIIVSVPMYAIMAGISVNEINFEAYHVRVKPDYIKKDVLNDLYDKFQKYLSKLEQLAPEEDLTYKNFFIFDYWLKGADEHFKNHGR